MKTTAYIQVVPIWAHWDKTKLYEIKVTKTTQKKPDKPQPGAVVIALTLDVADSLFSPIVPEATLVITPDGTTAGTIHAELLFPDAPPKPQETPF